MDAMSIASLATEMSQVRTANAVQMAVLKKTMDLQGQGAVQLVQAAAQTLQSYNNPPHLGRLVNVHA
ncbi:YjfB family protein [Denitratisoma oestradiolicum]|uniref:Motility protein n=1 Tax=Denitratisoma oestradiolicum TaxID=311182 RepID=A0A6S6YRZ0_9PROT|nr:YjfB family protein [Denitratisoma oestradiolicum]TWO78855.1 hypothetical protein CBW56_17875 [Denitratisoma oestradiolicum]CAB1370492.1 conserved protein of unknown function [Denitratisoma oestradiolicum]